MKSCQYLFLGMENTCPKFGPDPSENAWFCVKPTPSPICPRGWFFDMKTRKYFFPVDEKYMCQVWSTSVEKFTILRQTHPFPYLPWGLVFRYENMPVFFPGNKKYICQFWSRSIGKCTILRQTYPLTPFTLRVGFLIWKHASIFFREMKNTCPKFGPDPLENAWLCIKNPPLLPFWPP